MTQYVINIGAVPNDGTGDPLRTAFNEVNLNFDQVWATGLVGSNVQIANNTILTTNTNGNLILAPNGVGNIVTNVNILPNTSNIRSLGSAAYRWDTIYVQYANISGNLDLAGEFSVGDMTVTGNLTVTGNTIQVGNIVTETLTIQLANAAASANAANGAGLTVGANDNIATILYSSTSNTWTTNIGISSVGNVTAPYFFGNGSQLTGIASSYGNSNVATFLAAFGSNTISTTGNATVGNILPAGYVSATGNVRGANLNTDGIVSAVGNITGNYFIGNGSQLTGLSLSTGNIGFTGDAIYDLNGIILENADLTHGATAAVILPANGNTDPIQVNNTYGNIVLQTGAGSGITASWTFDNTGNVNLPTNGDINFNGGGIAQTLNEDLYIHASDDENDGWSIYNVVDDGAGNILSQTRLEYNQYSITTDAQGAFPYTWLFRDSGQLDLPGDIAGNVGGNLNVKIVDQAGSDTFIDLQTRSHTGDALISNIRIANPKVTVSTASAAYTWTFDNAGNLTVPGNIQTISTGFAFSSGIIAIDNTNPAVITIADSTFPSTVTGRVTISGVNPPVQANGTWYFEAVEANQFALYLDAELTQPVNATGWPGYVDGGLAVSPGYGNLAITGGNVSIVSQFGETWTFESGGALRIPNDIVSNATIDLDNRASGDTADIRLWAADDIFLQGRDKPDDAEAEGGDIFLYGGDGANAATSGLDTGSGGDVQIEGGIGGVGQASGTVGSGGGIITISGGDGGSSLDSTVGSGGGVNISAGSAADPISEDPTLGGLGGDVNISAGDTTRINENGGSIDLTSGSPTLTGTGAAGYVAINIASSNVGPGGNWTFTGTGTTLNVPADAEIFGPNAGNFTVGCAGNTIVTSSDYGSNVKNWVFGYTGNLTVPGNSIVSTADATGGAGGNSITIQAGAADQGDFYDTPGGNVNITGGLGAFNDGGGGGPGGDVNITGGLSSDPAGHAGNVNIGSGTSGWTFDYTGNITLPRGGVVYETNIPFGGLEGNTIALKPSGGTNADQQLLVYPTAGVDFNHLHLTSGNLWNTEMFLGNDDFYVKLANTGNIVINTNDSVGNTAQWTFGTEGTVLNSGNLAIQTPNGVPNSVTAITGSTGSWESNPVTDLPTTSGTGTGLTVNVTQEGGYAGTITIVTPGTGYNNGDVITVTSGSSSATFTISVAANSWTLDTAGALTLPAISLGTDLDEQTVISSQRKLIPPFRWSAVIDGVTPTVVYTVTDVNTTSTKVTVQIQHTGLGMEFFEVFATFTGSDTYYTVSNRVAPPTIDASTVVVDLNGSNEMQITVTINSGAATSWVTYDAVEFGIPND